MSRMYTNKFNTICSPKEINSMSIPLTHSMFKILINNNIISPVMIGIVLLVITVLPKTTRLVCHFISVLPLNACI